MCKAAGDAFDFEFSRFSPSKEALKLVELLCSEGNVELIALLSWSTTTRMQEGVFVVDKDVSVNVNHYCVLVLLSDTRQRPLHEWQNILEERCKQIAEVTVIVLEQETFYRWLREGHFFAMSVYRSAELLYGSFSNIPASLTLNDSQNQVKDGFKTSHARAASFFAGAELYGLRKEYTMAVFMLHQSVEQALHTLIKTVTGYHCTTHNVERLTRLCSMVTTTPAELFDLNVAKEKHLLSLLQKAYSEARYNGAFKVNAEEYTVLKEKTGQLIQEVSLLLTGKF